MLMFAAPQAQLLFPSKCAVGHCLLTCSKTSLCLPGDVESKSAVICPCDHTVAEFRCYGAENREQYGKAAAWDSSVLP